MDQFPKVPNLSEKSAPFSASISETGTVDSAPRKEKPYELEYTGVVQALFPGFTWSVIAPARPFQSATKFVNR